MSQWIPGFQEMRILWRLAANQGVATHHQFLEVEQILGAARIAANPRVKTAIGASRCRRNHKGEDKASLFSSCKELLKRDLEVRRLDLGDIETG